MADQPILFSGPMVRALLAGTKTQTRRVLKHPLGFNDFAGFTEDRKRAVFDCYPPICAPAEVRLTASVGDRLYVREHWRADAKWDDVAPSGLNGADATKYEADGAIMSRLWGDPFSPGRFRQGMHMPRWASRLTLIVTEVRVERLHDCSEADALAEGICADGSITDAHNHWVDLGGGDLITGWDAREVYRGLWNYINGPGAWALNPWVAAYTFRPILGNIDQLEAPHA